MSRADTECYFVLAGKDYAFRAWPQVPRVGDLVELGASERKAYIVTDILWAERRQGGDIVPGTLYVNVYIEESPK